MTVDASDTLQRSQADQDPARRMAATVIGWQGIRCNLPPNWNVTGFSVSRDDGYLRIDAPGDGAVTVQVRWSNPARVPAGRSSLYGMVAPYVRRMLRRPALPAPVPDLKTNLERVLRDSAKQARKDGASFESSAKPEKKEGAHEERTAINFHWHGAGRGQGKIWHCRECGRVVIAQVVGRQRDQALVGAVAAQLFASVSDHSPDGYDLWALYDFQSQTPDRFRLSRQELCAGYQHLDFVSGSERIVFDRWGLAGIALKKFTLEEWFRTNACVNLKRMQCRDDVGPQGHAAVRYTGKLPVLRRLRSVREAGGAIRRIPTRYDGAAWHCAESNRLHTAQFLLARDSPDLSREVLDRCVCH